MIPFEFAVFLLTLSFGFSLPYEKSYPEMKEVINVQTNRQENDNHHGLRNVRRHYDLYEEKLKLQNVNSEMISLRNETLSKRNVTFLTFKVVKRIPKRCREYQGTYNRTNGINTTKSIPSVSNDTKKIIKESVTTGSVTKDSVTTESVTTESVTTESVTTESVTTESATTGSATTDSVTTGSETTEKVEDSSDYVLTLYDYDNTLTGISFAIPPTMQPPIQPIPPLDHHQSHTKHYMIPFEFAVFLLTLSVGFSLPYEKSYPEIKEVINVQTNRQENDNHHGLKSVRRHYDLYEDELKLQNVNSEMISLRNKRRTKIFVTFSSCRMFKRKLKRCRKYEKTYYSRINGKNTTKSIQSVSNDAIKMTTEKVEDSGEDYSMYYDYDETLTGISFDILPTMQPPTHPIPPLDHHQLHTKRYK